MEQKLVKLGITRFMLIRIAKENDNRKHDGERSSTHCEYNFLLGWNRHGWKHFLN